jgi:hypothetical protein
MNRVKQSLARVLSGLLWLWAAILVTLIAVSFAGVTVGAYLDEPPPIRVAAWVFIGPAIGYLILSCLTVVLERPFWWMLGLILLWALNWDRAGRFFDALGHFSLGSVLWPRNPSWWIAWPLWIVAPSLLLGGLAHAHPDWLARWPSRILELRKSSGV